MPNVFPPPREGAIAASRVFNCTGEESQQLLACFMETAFEDFVTVPYALMVS